jgi:hypothetical protein
MRKCTVITLLGWESRRRRAGCGSRRATPHQRSFSWARNTLEDGRLHGYAPAPGFVSVADRHLAGAVVRPEETAAGSSPHRPAGSRARLLRRKGADRFPVACVEGAA